MIPRPNPLRADRLRSLPLESVLVALGAQPDGIDRRKWSTPQGTLSINGAKFFNWNQGIGGGGAIDLVIHLNHCRFTQALDWLQSRFPNDGQSEEPQLAVESGLKLPIPCDSKLRQVKDYLLHQRSLPVSVIDRLLNLGNLYADPRANAVFLMLDLRNRPIGAELRGTTHRCWRGLAPGSRKDRGYFSVTNSDKPSNSVILCESAIDAISCSELHPGSRCLSTAGARPDPAWLPSILESSSQVYCGFDADPTGDAMAEAMIARHPSIIRLRPSQKDWNERLRSPS